LLQAEQMGFCITASCEAREFSGRSNDSMARHDDRYWISSVRRADSSCRPRVAELFRELSVVSRLSKRYGQQGFPHIFLETSAPAYREQQKTLFASRRNILPAAVPSQEEPGAGHFQPTRSDTHGPGGLSPKEWPPGLGHLRLVPASQQETR